MDTDRVTPPPLRFPDPVREDLECHRPGLADETERQFIAHARPCVAVSSRRVADRPLRPGVLSRLFGAQPAAPVLGPLSSKFGGVPYCEENEDWSGHTFLGQLDLAEATAVLPPGAPRLTGLLRLDWGTLNPDACRVKWFPEPAISKAIAVQPESQGDWEARLEFRLSWTLPGGDALEALWPTRESSWYEYDQFYPAGYNEADREEFHRLLGHKGSDLDDLYPNLGFWPAPGGGEDLAKYEHLLELTYDRAADFYLGRSGISLLVLREDLERGDVSRVAVLLR